MTTHGEAVSAVDDAVSAVAAWCDQVRQKAEQRMGLPAGAESAIDDPSYLAALEVFHDLKSARQRLSANPTDRA